MRLISNLELPSWFTKFVLPFYWFGNYLYFNIVIDSTLFLIAPAESTSECFHPRWKSSLSNQSQCKTFRIFFSVMHNTYFISFRAKSRITDISWRTSEFHLNEFWYYAGNFTQKVCVVWQGFMEITAIHGHYSPECWA